MSGERLEEVKKKLLEMNEIVSNLDPAIRGSAFEILKSEYFDTPETPPQQKAEKKEAAKKTNSQPNDLEKYLSTYQHKKPGDNVMLLAAWLYSNYGSYAITAKEIQDLGDTCGLITPKRCDNTMRQAKNKGKSLFNQQGKGWKPTISGELYFKETYGVTKGTKVLPEEK